MSSARVQPCPGSLPPEQHSLERRERRAGGSVGGTLPFRSARALVPGAARSGSRSSAGSYATEPRPALPGCQGQSSANVQVRIHPTLGQSGCFVGHPGRGEKQGPSLASGQH